MTECFSQLGCAVLKYHAVMEEKRTENAVRKAGVIAHMVKDFWSRVVDVSFQYYCKGNSHF